MDCREKHLKFMVAEGKHKYRPESWKKIKLSNHNKCKWIKYILKHKYFFDRNKVF